MRARPRSNCLPKGLNGSRANAGFSIVELMVALTILSLMLMAAVPTYNRIQRKARTAAVVNDLRVFAAAFENHAHSSGQWPDEAAAGVIPPGVSAEELKADNWMRRTPIGGKYNWERGALYGGVNYRAAIAITDVAGFPLMINTDQFIDIDQAIDDGDLSKGNFLFFGDSPVFIIEK